MQNNQTGRKPGSKNKFTASQKKDMQEVFVPELRKLAKSMVTMEPHRQVKVLLDFLPYFLPKGVSSDEETEVQQIVYKQLERHYDRLGTYFGHVPQEKKAALLKSYLSYFSTKQKAMVLPIVKQQLKQK